MEKGTLVKFSNPADASESKLTMRVIEDNGDRVLVEFLMGLPINPTQTLKKSDVRTTKGK